MKHRLTISTVSAADAAADGPAFNWRQLQRDVDRGYRRFLARRGLPMPKGMREEVKAGFSEAIEKRRKR